MGGSGLVASFRSRANTTSPRTPDSKFHFMGLLRPPPTAPPAVATASATPTALDVHNRTASEDDLTGESAAATNVVLTTQLVGVNQLSKPTYYSWEKHQPVRKRRTIVSTRVTQRITTRMVCSRRLSVVRFLFSHTCPVVRDQTQMMLESHLGVPAASEEVEHFRACSERYEHNPPLHLCLAISVLTLCHLAS
jgi:hypothetical protein